MKRKVAAILAFVLLAGSTAAAGTWNLDASHSRVGFSVRHLVVTKVHGEFTDIDGALVFDSKDLSTGSVEMTVKIESVSTEDKKRDEHLVGPDFFDAEKYPTMTFKSTKVITGEGNEFKLVGNLTIKGVTKEVTFDGELNGVINDPWGNRRAGFSASGKIDRQDFGVSWSKTLDGGGLMVGDEVTMTLDLEVMEAK